MNEDGKHDLLLVSPLKLRIKHSAEAGTDWPYHLQYDNAIFYFKSWNKSEGNVYFVEKNIKMCPSILFGNKVKHLSVISLYVQITWHLAT